MFGEQFIESFKRENPNMDLGLPQEYIIEKIKNDKGEEISVEVPMYKGYFAYGRSAIQKLISDRRVPMSISELMQRRIDFRDAMDPDQEWKLALFYQDQSFFTGDAIAYHPSGKVKIALDSQPLRETKDKRIYYGLISLSEEQYDLINAQEFNKKELGELGKMITEEEARNHPVWKIVARDQKLLDSYVNYISEHYSGYTDFRKTDDFMKVSMFLNKHEFKLETPVMVPLELKKLGLHYNRSNLCGRNSLDYHDALFVGRKK